MSLNMTVQVTESCTINTRKLIQEKTETDTSGVALIVVSDVRIEGVEASCEVVGEDVVVTYAAGEAGVGTASFEAVLM